MRQLPSGRRRETIVPRPDISTRSPSSVPEDAPARVGEGEPVRLELLDDLDLGAGPQRERRLHRGADRVAAADALPFGRDDERRVVIVDLHECVEVAGVERRFEQRVERLGALGRHGLTPGRLIVRSTRRRLSHISRGGDPRILGCSHDAARAGSTVEPAWSGERRQAQQLVARCGRRRSRPPPGPPWRRGLPARAWFESVRHAGRADRHAAALQLVGEAPALVVVAHVEHIRGLRR